MKKTKAFALVIALAMPALTACKESHYALYAVEYHRV